jgi:hypothetical protein
MMQMQVQIPDYFTVKHHKQFSVLKSLNDMEQRLHVITTLTGESIETVKQWPTTFTIQLYAKLNELMANVEPEFYPVIEWEGVQYGYRPMHKMNLDEYIDLDTLMKDTDRNINDILAILYRPITENKLVSSKWIIKQTVKVIQGQAENAFNYYNIEKYDNNIRQQRSPQYDNFPASLALGALGFFLGSNHLLSKNMELSSPQWESLMNGVMKKKNKIQKVLARTTVGYISSMNLLKIPSYKSLEINV